MKELNIVKGFIENRGKFLLLRKIKDEIPEHYNAWEVPCGKIEENEDPRTALLREIFQETGLNCKILKELPSWQTEKNEIKINCKVFLLTTTSYNIKLSKEHNKYWWATITGVKNSKDKFIFKEKLMEYLELITNKKPTDL